MAEKIMKDQAPKNEEDFAPLSTYHLDVEYGKL